MDKQLSIDIEDTASGDSGKKPRLSQLPLGLQKSDLRRMAMEGASFTARRQQKWQGKNPPSDPADEMLAAFCAGEEEEELMKRVRAPINEWIETIAIPKIFSGHDYLCREKDSVSEWTINLKLPEPYQHHYAYATAYFSRTSMSDRHQQRLDRFNILYDRCYEESIRKEKDLVKIILILNTILSDALLV